MQRTAFSTAKQLESLNRALDVLESLAMRRGEMSLGAMARSLGMSKAGVYRILATMTARGYVDRSARGTYRLGVRAWELGCAVPQLGLVGVAAPFMERVTGQSRESSILGMRVGFDVVYLHRIEAFQAVRVHTDIGTRIPAHCTSTGLALLSQLTPAQLEAVLPPALAPYTASTITDPDRLRSELARTARRGYAIALGSWRPEVGGVAAPIVDADGVAVAAVNVSLPLARVRRRRLAELGEAIRETAADISRALRFAPGRTAPVAPVRASPAASASITTPGGRDPGGLRKESPDA